MSHYLRKGDLLQTVCRNIPVNRNPFLPGAHERSIPKGEFILILGQFEHYKVGGELHPNSTRYVWILTARGPFVTEWMHLENEIRFEGWENVVVTRYPR